MSRPFRATHRITAGTGRSRRTISVMLLDGAGYTRAEWDADDAADWEVVHGEWRFQGRVPPSCKVESIVGRPPRAGVTASKHFDVRCTEEERDAWRAAAGEQSVSEWIRGLANKEIARRKERGR